MLKHLDLFSGIGGFALGFRWAGGFEAMGFCEIDPFCRQVLARHWPDVPIYDDIRELDHGSVGPVDIITAGVPCQPASIAGRRKGSQDDRWLWPSALAVAESLRPRWAVFENPTGLLSMAEYPRILAHLERIGYSVEMAVIPAGATGAWHRRDRLWVIAHTDRPRQQQPSGGLAEIGRRAGDGTTTAILADAGDERHLAGRLHGLPHWLDRFGWRPDWDAGIPLSIPRQPRRRQRIKALGNAVVPQIPMLIGRAILEIETTP